MERLVDDIYTFKGKVEDVENDYIIEVQKKLKDYEGAEEQGLLLRLPCKVGDTVFLVQCGKVYERKVSGFSVTSNNRFVVHIPDCDMDNATLSVEQFGKILFLSRESALAEKGGAE